MYPTYRLYAIEEILRPPEGAICTQVLTSDQYQRIQCDFFEDATLLIDTLPDTGGAACCFVRLAPGIDRVARFAVQGAYQLEFCPSGGWLLKGSESRAPSYWIPQPPTLRTVDLHGRILSQQPASLSALKASSHELIVEIGVPRDTHLDLTLWCLPPEASDIEESLRRPLVLEKQSIFLGSSHSVYRGPSDVYLCLVHGHVYDNRFVWRPRGVGFQWRICSENEALSLYLALHGLELATKRRLYRVLKRQIVFSVIARQAPDGGWYHGEWTDLMESHYRLHIAGMSILEAALQEMPSAVVSSALGKAAAFLSRATDKTDIGTWFLHDSLEQSIEMITASGAPPWKPSRILGKSITNKLILNTHLDAVVVLDRYREVTGDSQYREQVASAHEAARTLLALRPAEPLYRIIFWAIGFTLLPTSVAKRLPLALRVIKRMTSKYLIPRLHAIKSTFPRVVMPGGLTERHLSPRHWDVNYHTVNIVDLTRVWRRFPGEDLHEILSKAVAAVTDTGLLQYWAESKQRQALGYWVEALYHLCTLTQAPRYRRCLAEAILYAEDAGVGLPASLLGGNSEAVKLGQQLPCPSPTDPRLRVANLSCGGSREILVVNCSSAILELQWEGKAGFSLAWTDVAGQPVPSASQALSVPPRGCLWGQTALASVGK